MFIHIHRFFQERPCFPKKQNAELSQKNSEQPAKQFYSEV